MNTADLKNYKGITPKPADFDAYWDKALGELKAVEPEVSMVDAEFQCPNVRCYDLYFTGVNGARIHGRFLRPAVVKGKLPAVLLFHGYNGNGGNWSSKLSFVLAGFAVFALDCRGQGGKSEDVGGVKGNTQHGHIIRGLENEDPHKLLFRDIFLDTAELAGIAMEMDLIDESRVYTHGGSQGGGLSLVCAALEPRIKKTAAVYPFLSDYQRAYELQGGAFNELREYFRNSDPLHEREREVFTKLGYIDVKNLAPRIQAETLIFTGLEDAAVPPATQYAIYNNLQCKKKHLIYPDYGHEDIWHAGDVVMDFLIEK